jgi:hypothetical protein
MADEVNRFPSAELGRWLRRERQTRSWNIPEMTRRLRQAATAAGDRLPANECLFTMIRRWERGDVGVSERYRLYYCKTFGIDPESFGTASGGGPASGGPASGDSSHAAVAVKWPPAVQWLIGMFTDVRDVLREDAKLSDARADQMRTDAARAALCRGQALAYLAAAECIGAALSDGLQGALDRYGAGTDEDGEDD